jgi:hypothetical protein
MNLGGLNTIFTLLLIVWVAVIVILWAGGDAAYQQHRRDSPQQQQPRQRHDSKALGCEGPVDVVITWVNGTDPAQIAAYEQHAGTKMTAQAMRRFRDYGMLRFVVRSVEKFAPWVRRTVLVTNGQEPGWLRKGTPRAVVVPHSQVFADAKHDLPTFNSNAIEANLRHIPGLTDCFLYLNDDFYLARPVELAQFVDSASGKLRLYVDRYSAPEEKEMKHNIWHRSVARMNTLINEHYRPGSQEVVRHNYAGHSCYFMRKWVLDSMAAWLGKEFEATSARKFRHQDDTALPFLAVNVAIEEGVGEIAHTIRGAGGSWGANHTKNEQLWRRLEKSSPHCVCLQDGFEESSHIEQEIAYLEELLCSKFPEPSSVEQGPNPCEKWSRGK